MIYNKYKKFNESSIYSNKMDTSEKGEEYPKGLRRIQIELKQNKYINSISVLTAKFEVWGCPRAFSVQALLEAFIKELLKSLNVLFKSSGKKRKEIVKSLPSLP